MPRISRRDFFRGSFAAALSALFPGLLGPGGRVLADPDRPPWPREWSPVHADSPAVFEIAHRLRDGEFSDAAPASVDAGDPVYDLVVVGGGISGLAAALRFRDDIAPAGRVLILENNTEPGGNARNEAFEIGGRTVLATQAAAYVEKPWNDELRTFYRRLGIDLAQLAVPLDTDRAFFDRASHGCDPVWVPDVWGEGMAGVPLTQEHRLALATFRGALSSAEDLLEGDGAGPLDQITFRAWIARQNQRTEEILRFADLYCGDSLGANAASVSAASGISFLSEHITPGDIFAFPGGNGGFARMAVRALLPDALPGEPGSPEFLAAPFRRDALDRSDAPVRLRLGATVVRIEHEGAPDAAEHLRFTYLHAGTLHHVRARTGVLAGAKNMARHVVRDLPDAQREAFAKFRYGAYLVANVGLRRSAAIDRAGLGYQGCYFAGLGKTLEVADWVLEGGKPKRDPERPNVISLFCPLMYPDAPPEEQGKRGRTELLATPFLDFERRVLADLARILGPFGLEVEQDVVALSLNRWGHAMVTGYPGFRWTPRAGGGFDPGPCRVAARLHGRLAFAHTDLEGTPYFEAAVTEGRRAAAEAGRRLR